MVYEETNVDPVLPAHLPLQGGVRDEVELRCAPVGPPPGGCQGCRGGRRGGDGPAAQSGGAPLQPSCTLGGFSWRTASIVCFHVSLSASVKIKYLVMLRKTICEQRRQ
ncbi:unnamed protein product [Prorocentrum cordatum]|uniref:Uncharacterized protein n=1 Tax=Prorocentrum cordatum TaxID=2364126 RepID=A0ABN9QID1_9DINO|nr:unnamed protein product [Polarella glacialis]